MTKIHTMDGGEIEVGGTPESEEELSQSLQFLLELLEKGGACPEVCALPEDEKKCIDLICVALGGKLEWIQEICNSNPERLFDCLVYLARDLLDMADHLKLRTTSKKRPIPPYKETIGRDIVERWAKEYGGTLERPVDSPSSRSPKIEAIKEVREATGWGLKESKDFVEKTMMEGRAMKRDASP